MCERSCSVQKTERCTSVSRVGPANDFCVGTNALQLTSQLLCVNHACSASSIERGTQGQVALDVHGCQLGCQEVEDEGHGNMLDMPLVLTLEASECLPTRSCTTCMG